MRHSNCTALSVQGGSETVSKGRNLLRCENLAKEGRVTVMPLD
jgi:hypothetical protein